jgi:hypothetical protein
MQPNGHGDPAAVRPGLRSLPPAAVRAGRPPAGTSTRLTAAKPKAAWKALAATARTCRVAGPPR